MTQNEFLDRLKADAELIEAELEKQLDSLTAHSPELVEAMKYATLGGGKRIRGILCLEFARLFHGSEQAAIKYAAAIEMMHAASLVHDDLPALDNDDMRRGKPSCHKKYSEHTAILVGDALICHALMLCANNGTRAAGVLARAGGSDGIASGQMLDIDSENKKITYDELLKLQSLKTGKLMSASALLGALCGNLSDAHLQAAEKFGEKLGLAFQIQDDLLDAEEGGSDDERGLATFLTFMSAGEAKAVADKLIFECKRHISAYDRYEFLTMLCDYLAERTY